MRSPTTSPAPPRPASSRCWTTRWSRSPASTSPSSRWRPTGWAPRCGRSAKPWPSGAPSPRPCRRPCGVWRPAGTGSTPIRGRGVCGPCPTMPWMRRWRLPVPDGSSSWGRRSAGVWSGGTPGPIHRHRPLVPGPDGRDLRAPGRVGGGGRAPGRSGAGGQADGVLGRSAVAHLGGDRGRYPGVPASSRHPADLQAGRYLRRRVRSPDPLLLLHLRGRERGGGNPPASGGDPRVRSQPDRPGHRVRLLLRACRLRSQGGRLRDRDGQLQPRDGLHRLRHLRPPLLRAPDGGGRVGDLRCRGSRGGSRPTGRPDPAQPGRTPGGERSAHRRHSSGPHR